MLLGLSRKYSQHSILYSYLNALFMSMSGLRNFDFDIGEHNPILIST